MVDRDECGWFEHVETALYMHRDFGGAINLFRRPDALWTQSGNRKHVSEIQQPQRLAFLQQHRPIGYFDGAETARNQNREDVSLDMEAPTRSARGQTSTGPATTTKTRKPQQVKSLIRSLDPHVDRSFLKGPYCCGTWNSSIWVPHRVHPRNNVPTPVLNI